MMALAGLLLVLAGFLGLVLFVVGSIILLICTALWNVTMRINEWIADRKFERRERRRKIFKRIFKI